MSTFAPAAEPATPLEEYLSLEWGLVNGTVDERAGRSHLLVLWNAIDASERAQLGRRVFSLRGANALVRVGASLLAFLESVGSAFRYARRGWEGRL
jgi:hypothetical protein